MILTRKILIATIAVVISPVSHAYWLADMQVEDVEVTKQGTAYTCIAEISNLRDDDARNAKAFIMLPPKTQFVSFSTNENNSSYNVNSGHTYSSSYTTTDGINCTSTEYALNSYVQCEIGGMVTKNRANMDNKENVKITITGIISPTPYDSYCSVFVTSSSPDQDHSNNYKSKKPD